MPKNHDPSAADLIEFFEEHYPNADSFDREEAIYWFAEQHHSGQTSNLYSILSTSPFKPGPLATVGKLSGMALEIYDALRRHFLHTATVTLYATVKLKVEYNPEALAKQFNEGDDMTDEARLCFLVGNDADYRFDFREKHGHIDSTELTDVRDTE